MKKILTLALVVAMFLALSVNVFAATDIATNAAAAEENIIIAVATDYAEDPVYYVEVDWDDATLTCTKKVTKTWKPEEHKYDETVTGYAWTSLEIKVKNHSNVEIDATLNLPSAEKGVTLKEATDTLILNNIARAEANGDFNTAPTGTFTITAVGNPDGHTKFTFTVAATVSIS